MSELLLGWPNGVLGMIFASLGGILVMYALWRRSPWDTHDENSYPEPKRLTFDVLAPDIVRFGALIALMLGVGALDKHVWPVFALVGDFLGLAVLGLAIYYLLIGSRKAPIAQREPVLTGHQLPR
jgi:hypothetical protein